MKAETKNKCKVVSCNKNKIWISTFFFICSVVLLACASEQQETSNGVTNQNTEVMAAESGEPTSDAENEAINSTEQVVESIEAASTESIIEQTATNNNIGNLDVEGRLLQVNGKLYYATSETGPMGDAGCVAGHIETAVAAGENPQKDGESNFDCVGNPYTYDSGDGSIQVLMEDENYYWFHSDEKIEWQEFTRFVVTNGNNGEQQERSVADSDSSYAEVQAKLEGLHLWDIPDESRVGYPYCLRTYDDAGNLLQTITIYQDTINFDGDLYKEGRVECIKELYEVVETLYGN